MFARSLMRKLSSNQKSRQGRKNAPRLHCESLECRRVLAVVTSLADSGPGTLREALAGTDATITFAVSGTIDVQTQLVVARNVVIDGSGQTVTVRNIGADSRVFNIDDGTANVVNATIRGLAITGGNVSDVSPSTVGGGIRVNGETLRVEDSTVSGNTARSGGGIGLVGGANVTLSNVTVANNTARVNGGGASVPAAGFMTILGSRIEANSTGLANPDITTLAIGGGIHTYGSLTIWDSHVLDNVASTPDAASLLGYGGGIGVSTDGSLVMERTQVLGNSSDRGGGLALRRAPVVIRDSVISGNTSADNGGGIRMMRSSTFPIDVTIENTTFADNIAYGGGGIGSGTYAGSQVSASTLTLTGSTIANNQSDFDGGGLELVGTNALLENVTLSGNSAANQGGGLWHTLSAVYTGSTTLRYSTITENSAVAQGGGIYTGYPSFAILNSIVSGNETVGGYGTDVYDVQYLLTQPADIRYSLIANAYGHGAENGVSGNITGTPANLGVLTDNGGLTHTHMLLPGPGINGADPASTLMFDQRGYTRPGANSSRDMGSVEADGVSATVHPDFNGDGNYNCADMDLLEAAIDGGGPVATFDVNGDGILSSADVFAWLIAAGELRFGAGRAFRPGDADLSGAVDGSDFGAWNANKFTSANRWCQGDFNQDNAVDGSDFGIWNANKFTTSDNGRPGTTEPRARRAPGAGRAFTNKEFTIEAQEDRWTEQGVSAIPSVRAPQVALGTLRTVGVIGLAPPSISMSSHTTLTSAARSRGMDPTPMVQTRSIGEREESRDALFGEVAEWHSL